VDNLDRPDFAVFDLDPGQASFEDVRSVAWSIFAILDLEGYIGFVKTSGKTGLHVLTPWSGGGYDEARAWALGIAHRVVAESPELATVEIRKAKRGRRVYVDVLQNARGHHVVAPYALRAVPAATVSMPLRWLELMTSELTPAAFTPQAVLDRLSRRTLDPFAGLIPGLPRPRSKPIGS
jgi:bifunctional non-homologous end joining protein LigD